MSSSEGEHFNFDSDGSESDDYSPVAKKVSKPTTKSKPLAKVAKAPAKPKPAAAKPKTTAKKVLTTHDDNAEDSFHVEKSMSDLGEPGPSASIEPGKKKAKTASETYTTLSHIEHILVRPDSYIGSIETVTQSTWSYDSSTKRMVFRELNYVPAFFKIVDEILVNAADNKINDPSMDTIKVDIDVESCTISVFNNGRGIPIEIHTKEKMYIPQLIFGHLLAGANFDDDEKKLTGGRNGLGAKLANIYSHEFTVDTADKNSAQKYKQTWTDNMSKINKPKITKNSKGEEYTRVTFRPDLKRFGMTHIDDDALALLRKRVYDLAGTVKNVKVYLNDERLKIKNFKQYVELYLDSAAAEATENSGGAIQPKQSVIYEQINGRWEVALAVSEGSFQQVSFANSIATTKGGTHVTLIADQIAKNLITAIAKKNKGAAVKPAQIKNHMWIFVNALVENPTFDSQTKETLKLPADKFGTKPVLSEEFMKKVLKSAIIDHVLNWAKFKADQQIKKSDGTKRSRLTGLPKLSDANNAGTKKASDCTLILTEGDSAKTLAVAGLAVVGRDNFGVFPLRGKLLNVREAKHDQIMKNEEIQNIKKILGLQHNKEYSSVSTLRYGQIMIMTDQDYDGSHIKGLLINFLDHFFPSLLKIPNFLVEFVTPIVRVRRGKRHIDFFTIPDYERWSEQTPDASKWDPKYYKGLGTSQDQDSCDYFSDMKKHMIPFDTIQEGDRELFELAFSKKKADERKEWLRQYQPGTCLDHTKSPIMFSDFINKELILFSMADNIRSIPSIADGLKPGQRKVIWGCFKRKLTKEIKVVQLAGFVSEHSAYHHGEVSLTMTIVNLAQSFVGSNNINLLLPNGQFGTRDQGGKDHASARYIYTELAPLSRAIFHPSDDPLLKPLKEDGIIVEPEWYLPVVPLLLVNGAEGIGTGWSTNIPSYNPVDIVANLRRLMVGEELVPMLPWWKGFKGEIKKTAEHKYDVLGIARKTSDTTIEITELPIHKWTQSYKVELEGMIGEKGDGVIKDYKEHHDNVNVHFVIHMEAKDVQKAEEQGLLEFFKLTSKINTSNMIGFDFEGKIKKYRSPEEILEEFYPIRLAQYQKRKDYLANELQDALDKLSNQARFIQMIVDKELVVSNRKKASIVAELRKKKFRPFPRVKKGITEKEESAQEEQNSDDGDDSDYDYLLGMAIGSLTTEKIEKLRQQSADKEAELLSLLEKTPVQLWNSDLDQFLEQWQKSYEEFEQKTASNSKPVKRKQTSLRKSWGRTQQSDDSEDDFRPNKAAAKAKKPLPPSKPARSAVTKKGLNNDSDGPHLLKPKTLATKKPPKTDQNSNVMVAKQVPEQRSVVAHDISSDSDVVVKPAPPKGKGKAKEAPAPKRKSLDPEGDSDDELLKPAKKHKPAAKNPTSKRVSSSMKPAKPRAKQVASGDDSMDYDEPPARVFPLKRAARAAPKSYVDLISDDGGSGEGSDFEDD